MDTKTRLLKRALETLEHISECEYCGTYYAGGLGRNEPPHPEGDAVAMLHDAAVELLDDSL